MSTADPPMEPVIEEESAAAVVPAPEQSRGDRSTLHPVHGERRVSEAEAEHMGMHAHQLKTLTHGTKREREALAKAAGPSLMKAVSTLAKIAIESNLTPEKHIPMMKSIAVSTTPTDDKKKLILTGGSFGSVMKKIGSTVGSVVGVVAPFLSLLKFLI